MGLSEDPSSHSQNQGTSDGNTSWRKRRARHPRSRVCLLKGCGQTFRPEHPLTRYCSEPCREQARQWWEWKARHQYRQSDGGKQKRQAQSRRYRLRRKDRKKQEASTVNGARVITTKFFFVFLRSRRSPLQRFCSHACRRALERVLERERRWRERQPARR